MRKKEINTFDFSDGRGAISAHRHINPDGSIGGWVADCVVISVDAKVTIGEKVRFSGYFKTFIRGGTFRGGTFEGGTFWGGTFWGGTFEGGTFRGGTFRGGTFRGGTFLGGTIKTNRDFIVFACVGSRNDTLTVQFEDEPLFTTGCKSRITLKEFSDEVEATHGNNTWGIEYRILIKTVKEIWKIRQVERKEKE